MQDFSSFILRSLLYHIAFEPEAETTETVVCHGVPVSVHLHEAADYSAICLEVHKASADTGSPPERADLSVIVLEEKDAAVGVRKESS